MADWVKLTPVMDHVDEWLVDRDKITHMVRWHHVGEDPDPQTFIYFSIDASCVMVRETPEQIISAPRAF